MCKVIMTIHYNFKHMTIWIWLYEYDYTHMTIRIWLYAYDYMHMTIRIWLYAYDYTKSIHIRPEFDYTPIPQTPAKCVQKITRNILTKSCIQEQWRCWSPQKWQKTLRPDRHALPCSRRGPQLRLEQEVPMQYLVYESLILPSTVGESQGPSSTLRKRKPGTEQWTAVMIWIHWPWYQTLQLKLFNVFSPSRDGRDLRAKRKQSIVKYFTERVVQNQNVEFNLG